MAHEAADHSAIAKELGGDIIHLSYGGDIILQWIMFYGGTLYTKGGH